MREAKKKKRICKKLYPDWKDDEYNILECKFIWGIPHHDAEKDNPSFVTYNKIQIYYNRETKLYYLEIDDDFFALHTQESMENYIEYLTQLKKEFAQFVFADDEDGILVGYPVHAGDIIVNGIFGSTIQELYFKFSVLLKGLIEYYS